MEHAGGHDEQPHHACRQQPGQPFFVKLRHCFVPLAPRHSIPMLALVPLRAAGWKPV